MEKRMKRRKFFIKKDFQGKLILGCFLFITGGGLLFHVLLKQVPTANWLMIIVGGGFVMLASLLLSHRIAGPLYRFETTLDKMQKGCLTTSIRLRDKDEGKDLARKINELNNQLSQSFCAISHNSKALEALIEQATTLALPEKEKEELASLCWAMQEHNRKIAGTCNYFCSRDQ